MGHISKEIPDELLAMLRYEPDTGSLYWAVSRRGNIVPGSLAGSLNGHGYVEVKFRKAKYLAHRIAWKLAHGALPLDGHIDHENTIKSDNRLINLRRADKVKNGANRRKNKNNTSGYKGVTRNNGKRIKRWTAQINVDGKHIYLGDFHTPEEAHASYTEAAIRAYGEFARAA